MSFNGISSTAHQRKAKLSSYISRDIIIQFIIHYSLLIINYHEKVRMEYYYQSDHRRSYRHRGSTWHPILYSLIFNFQLSIFNYHG